MLLIAKEIQTNKQKIFLTLDEENLPFKNNQFNLVFSNLYLHWSNAVSYTHLRAHET